MLFWCMVMLFALTSYDSYRRGGWALAACTRIIEALGRISLGKMIFYGGLATLVLGLSVLFGGDGAYLAAFLAPELLVWFTLFDIAALIDVTVLVLAVGARSVIGQVRQTLGTAMPRLIHRLCAPRQRSPKTRARKPAPPSSDPERPHAFRLVLA